MKASRPSLRWFPCRMRRLWTQALRSEIPCSSPLRKEKSQWRKSLPRTWTSSVMATAKAVPCSCSTALASVPSAPVMISVMKARRFNMTQMFRILGKRGRITIPFEIRQRVGFSYNDVLSFTEAPDGRTVIVKREKICDNCAAEKPQRKEAEDTITLFDFLNGLSDEQQKAAFAHLKLKWDRVQGSGLYGRS